MTENADYLPSSESPSDGEPSSPSLTTRVDITTCSICGCEMLGADGEECVACRLVERLRGDVLTSIRTLGVAWRDRERQLTVALRRIERAVATAGEPQELASVKLCHVRAILASVQHDKLPGAAMAASLTPSIG